MAAQESAARIIRTVIQLLEPQFAVELWNGERIGETDGPVLVINSPMAVRQLALKPNIGSIVELWISSQIDVKNGTLFDLVERGPKGKFKQKLKSLPKWQLLKDVPALLLGGGKSNLSGLDGKNPFVSGSNKEAITHHYDVSNAFYQLFLDDRMVYTCAYFTDWANSIDQAQADKLELICRKLRLQPGDRLLDIGCGWGAMLIYAAKHYGVTGTGVSLSEAQTALARERIKAEGLEDKITIHVKSYEELAKDPDMQFDKISSIGMFEAVGIAHYDTYFSSVNKLLRPGGLYLHHAITRRMKRNKKTFGRKSAEHLALVKYIFPGGELDHLGMTIENLEGYGFEVHDAENLREHYGKTCRIWADRLHARFDEAIAEVGAPKARLWLLYLTGCALAFERGTVQINQTLASKRKRGISAVPQTRADLYR
ncbi:class I SAM-dependent methyltransferase [Phyllobacterium sp. 628]|uniref:SAM-dependent methyltransferase n=1 Tax=Phyllobacterium sp. 628 TaxID=2718938 RepID=UPI00166244B0|nr:cyclopropane-fatty-acyl-phospholipid synthase family protein [Phyllobacterium sp. 628]QND51056.1 class I SAM-dependent methyltransferase [Phyllobacterium sp. 628]